MRRFNDLTEFYELLANLESNLGGKRTLENCDGRMNWPQRGIYFFFETGENRDQSSVGLRVVRVGTHALREHSNTTLWHRLKQHKGNDKGGGGNHRCSIFRSHIGSALIKKDNWASEIQETWGIGQNAPREIRILEKPLEQSVSQYIRKMPFLWLEVNDEPGPNSLRGYIEGNSIALLSNYNSAIDPIDSPSSTWLGYWAKSEKVRNSGLWNSDHVMDTYDPKFLEILKRQIDQ
ncbi:MAG: hypothetical protein IT308_08095 [Anaerolineaceae bacterium]|nr:hypothetical protein [Anaerolineaceae bacterium]